jgi:HSP20 family protein
MLRSAIAGKREAPWGEALSPARVLRSVRADLNHRFHALFGCTETQAGGWAPPVDLYEADNALILMAELPGYGKGYVDVEFTDNTLRLKGERQHETAVQEAQYVRREFA